MTTMNNIEAPNDKGYIRFFIKAYDDLVNEFPSMVLNE